MKIAKTTTKIVHDMTPMKILSQIWLHENTILMRLDHHMVLFRDGIVYNIYFNLLNMINHCSPIYTWSN
jgi:hypothetical protein